MKMFGAQLISSLTNFIGLILFARAIGAHQLGIYFLFQAVVSVLLIPADVGLRGALEKRISEDGNGSEMLSSVLLMKLIPILCVSASIVLFHEHIDRYVGMKIAAWVIVALIITESYYIVKYLLRGELQVNRAADMMAIRQTVWLGLGILFVVVFKFDAIGLVYAYILGPLVAMLYGLRFRTTELGTPSHEAARSLFDYAKFDVIAGTGAELFSWLDVLIIGVFLSQSVVGAYETAWRLSAAAVTFGMAIRVTIFPQFSNWNDRGDIERVSRNLSKITTASLFLVIPAFAGALVFSAELLGLVFDQEFVIASTALIILMAHRITQAINQTIGRTLQAIDRPDLAAYATGVGIVSNVVLNVLLVPIFGIEGAAVATFLSFAAMTAIRTMCLNRHLPITLSVVDISWCAAAAAVMAAILHGANQIYEVTRLYELILAVGFGAIIYFGVIFLSDSLRGQLVEGARNTFQ